MAKMCFLFGHRDAPPEILPDLEGAIERYYDQLGMREFVVGQYGRFDRLAAQAARSVRKRHEDMRLWLLLPYHPAERPVETPEGFDGTLYPDGMEGTPRRMAIVRANRRMLVRAEGVICYAARPGNSRRLLEEACRRASRGLTAVENLAGPTGG